jgi:hypothetical protein
MTSHKDLTKAALKKIEEYEGDTGTLEKTTSQVTRYTTKCLYWLHSTTGQPFCVEWVKTDPYTATAYKTSAQVFRCEYDPSQYPQLLTIRNLNELMRREPADSKALRDRAGISRGFTLTDFGSPVMAI